MADASIRENLLANIKTKLEGIIGGGTDYHYSASLKSVQRYIHDWEGSGHTVNELRETPTIILRVLSEVGRWDTAGLWTNTLELDIQFVIRGEDSGDTSVSNALADLKRALFTSFDGFGGRVTEVDWSNRLVDPQSGMPIDGIHLTLTLTYHDQLGVPSAGL